MSCPSHLALAADWPRVEAAVARGSWGNLALETSDDDLVRYVHAYPRRADKIFWHCFRMGFASYPGQPPSVLCVHPVNKERAHANHTPWWPQVTGNPYVNLQPSSEPPYFCFPYTLEYALTHGPAAEERHRWATGKHTVYATLTELRRILRPPFYQGYFDVSFEEALHAQMATTPSTFSPY